MDSQLNGKRTPVSILITEDDDGHAALIEWQLREAGVDNPMMRFCNGQEVWNFLTRCGSGPMRSTEDAYLMLLDLRMPIMDGLEVLRNVKADPVLKTLPVIMLTTTDDPQEIEACYRLGCNVYITKPVAFAQFAEALRRLGLILTIVQAPVVAGAGG
ncbi:MAG: response regulator [Anaerolineales bacterium]|nr:response regulator [Anaerolineales bacterium]